MKLPKITGRAWRKAAIGAAVLVAAITVFNAARGYGDFRRELVGLEGVRLNDSRAEVMYRLGSPPLVLGPPEPDILGGKVVGQSRPVLYVGGPKGDQNTMPAGRSTNDYQAWVYSRDTLGTDLIVEFDKAGRVQSITCTAQGENLFACGPLAGVRNTDPEEKVLGLGAPSTNSVDGVTKTIEYADIGVRYYLTKGRAYSFTLKRPTGGRWAVLHRYVERLLP